MEDRIAKWLHDIKCAIEEIERFMPDSGKGIHLLQENVMFKRALERNIEIIGEAVNRILMAGNDPSPLQCPQRFPDNLQTIPDLSGSDDQRGGKADFIAVRRFGQQSVFAEFQT